VHPSTSGLPTWAIILIVIGSIVVIGVIVGFVIRNRKLKKDLEKETLKYIKI
jgi:hypothetical protein